MTRGRLVRGLRETLHARGVEIPRRRAIGGGLGVALRRLGAAVQPRTVIDVGVAYGTPGLYGSFPHAQFLLVEPIVEYEPAMRRILSRVEGSYVLAAATSQAGETVIGLASTPGGSSLYVDTDDHSKVVPQRQVPTVRLDEVCRSRQLQGPYLIKLDVQGAELDALEGADGLLPETVAITLETSLFGFYRGAPQFHDVVAWMKGRGFVAYDVLRAARRPLDGALAQVDLLFVQEDGPLRAQHTYSSSDPGAAAVPTARADS